MSRSVVLFAIFVLFLALSFAPLGTEVIVFIEEDDIPQEDDTVLISSLPISWTRGSVYQSVILLKLGLSMFTLFVVYLGGRSKDRIFNDRTIDADLVLEGVTMSLKAAQNRAVFNFFNSLKYRVRPVKNIVIRPTIQSYGGTTL